MPHVCARRRTWLETATAPATLVVAAALLYAVILFVVIPAAEQLLGARYGIGFADDYDRLAASLASGEGYRFRPDLPPTLMREPGYPLFLAGVFTLLGVDIEAARLANLVLAALAAMLVMRLASSIGLSRAAAAAAAAIFLLHPGTMIAAARGGFEIFFSTLMLLFMLALSHAARTGMPKRYVVAGVLLGLAVLTRSTAALFPLLALAFFVVDADTRAERLRYGRHFALLLAAAALVVSPWVVRNYRVTGEIVPTATVQGVAAQAGQHICRGLSFERGMQELDTQAAVERNRIARALGYRFDAGYYQYFHFTRDELAFNRHLLGKVVSEYRSEPALWAKCAFQNVFNFWFSGKSWPVTLANMAIQGPFLLLAAFGGYRLWRSGKRREIALPVLFVVHLFATHVPIHAQARYSVPLIPFLAIFAAAGLAALLTTLASGRLRISNGTALPRRTA